MIYPDYLIAARQLSLRAHGPTTNKHDGELYLLHVSRVAFLAAPYGSLAEAVAWLHDVVEDCDVSVEELSQRFGAEVGRLVEGATKIDQLPAVENQNADAETLRKRPESGIGFSFTDDARKFVAGKELDTAVNTAIAVGEPVVYPRSASVYSAKTTGGYSGSVMSRIK